jgi:hypothetical protein
MEGDNTLPMRVTPPLLFDDNSSVGLSLNFATLDGHRCIVVGFGSAEIA